MAPVAALAAERRRQHAEYQPQFWRAAPGAVEKHTAFLRLLLADDAVSAFVGLRERAVVGFAIGRLVAAPPVYEPGGLTGMVDDFAVADDADWPTVGRLLLRRLGEDLRTRGASQVVVVTAARDAAKRDVLLSAGLSLASEWFVGSLVDRGPT